MGSKDTSTIREYQKALHSSLRQYNFQSILWKMSRVLALPLNSNFEEEGKYQKRIRQVFGHDEYNALDNAYYNAGNRRARSAGDVWIRLKDSEFGQHFILEEKDIQAGLRSD